MDDNHDGVITVKEINAFKPCKDYQGKKITRAFREFGRRVDLNDFSQAITPKQGITSNYLSSRFHRKMRWRC